MPSIEHLAEGFCRAFYSRKWLDGAAPEISTLSIAGAYQVQDEVAARRVALGERVVGYKVGCTSAAIRQQFGLREPIYGRLFSPHTADWVDRPIDWSHFANCAIEPEMVLEIGSDLRGDLSDQQLVDGIVAVRPGVELHHFKFWKMPPTTQELICTGGIHAGLIIGEPAVEAERLRFSSERFSVFKNGQLVTSAVASEIMGSPLNSLRWLVAALTQRGQALAAGSLVIPGSPTQLVTIDADCLLRIEIEKVGGLSVRFLRPDGE